MTTPEQLVFKGAPGSPYSRKMLAYLRYRHIRYRFLVGEHTRAMDLPVPKVSLLPTFYLPNDKGELEAVVDSTPLIRRFEASFKGRTTLPPDPVLNFLNYLVEDYADEWLTKSMFHYRWYFNADIDMAGTILPLWSNIKAPKEHLKALKQSVCDRQISRLYVVGSNDVTAPVIEDSYKRFLNIFDSHHPETAVCIRGTTVVIRLRRLCTINPTREVRPYAIGDLPARSPSSLCLDRSCRRLER